MTADRKRRTKAPPRRLDELASRIKSATDWQSQHEAAVEYWVALHPDLARFRNLTPERVPTRDEFLALADQLNAQWAGSSRSADAELHGHGAWRHVVMDSLYGPVDRAIEQMRAGDPGGIETAVRFLEADPYCFRSGYAKADLIRFLTRMNLDQATVDRLRAVVLDVAQKPTKREFRAYIRLARRIDSDRLRHELGARARSQGPGRGPARQILVALGERSWEEGASGPSDSVAVFDDPEFDLWFMHPARTLSRERVRVERHSRPDGIVVRLSAGIGDDVYVEVRQVAQASWQDTIEGLRRDVSARFEKATFGPIETAELAELAARGLTFSFEGRTRRALVSEQESPSYAVVYDPSSILSDLVVQSLRLRDS